MIEAEGLSKFYGDFAATRDISFTINQGEVAAFLGPNFRGDYGLLSGTQPDPGLYLSARYLRYDADKLLNSSGDPIGPDPGQPGSIGMNAGSQ